MSPHVRLARPLAQILFLYADKAYVKRASMSLDEAPTAAFVRKGQSNVVPVA